jgi:hypothetical protein
MDRKTAVKIIQRRLGHLNKRIESATGSESALLFDQREREALQFVIDELEPPKMAEPLPESLRMNQS